MLRRILADFRQLHFALRRFYQRRNRRPLTPEQEVERSIARLNREQQALRRLTWRR